MMKRILIALTDLMNAFAKIDLALMLGWQDIKQRYRRSKLGPFWLTISMGVMISMIGIIFGQALSVPFRDYLPYVATGIIFWNFVSSGISEGCTSFIHSSGMIRQLSLPLTLYPIQVLWRNIVVLGHNILMLPIVLIVVGRGVNLNLFWIIPGFILLVLNIFWISLLLGVFCTRFRDLPPIVNSLLQVFFYITPILWMPHTVTARVSSWIVITNPAYHLIELVRAPILGYCPSLFSWVIGLCVAVLGLLICLVIFGTYRKRIAYWI